MKRIMSMPTLLIRITVLSFILFFNFQFAFSQCGGENLIVNGGFEEPDVATFVEELTGGDLPGWTITGGNIDIIDQNTGFGADWANNGDQSIDLNGKNAAGTIEQTIPTEEGRVYFLSFFLSTNDFCTPGIPRPNQAVIVRIDGIVVGFFDSPANPTWEPHEVQFVGAPGTETKIEFISNIQFEGTDVFPSGCGALLDDVAVRLCVEEIEPPENVRCITTEGENLVSNFSFETDDASADPGYLLIPSQLTSLTDWDVSGQIDLIHVNFIDPPKVWSTDGNQGLDMNGINAPGAISQNIPTEPNTVYEISFNVSSNFGCTTPKHGLAESITLEIDDSPINTYSTPTNPNWITYVAHFTSGSGNSTKIEFISEIDDVGDNGCGPLLDEIVVLRCGPNENPIPTLSQWAIIILSILILIVGLIFINGVLKIKEREVLWIKN